ncbi:probable fructose-2,6-bisphosphatase TIGAR A isoform X2 [Dunckerocampus dactyliophorus]|uniref:probable fructose-2,6-bisphosphatase TIGAR A isoform X2 n=1 Tax=Dunckerocampus dactyliophorus TaxID=161453 RepID=UPI0024076D93|nr:probable fructose-2,6-bisphosphatase TIGAR A isoform X2 [Dunckerocampus dactyliophorus]
MRRVCNFVDSLQGMKTLTFGLTFVRHGETQFNQEGRLQGQAIDSALSDVGLQQAEAAGRYLKDVKFTNVFVSDMLRARQSFGTAEGQLLQELREMARTAGQSFLDFTPPQGETQEQVKQRVQEFWRKMLHQIGCEHWPNRSDDDVSVSTPVAAPHGERETDDVPVHALVVGHGAYMCVTMRYLVDDLHCSIPQGCTRAHVFSLCPNAGVSRFVLTLNQEKEAFKVSAIRCLFVNKGDHVKT